MSDFKSRFKAEASILLKLGGPIIGTQLFQTGLNVTDTIMAGNLSALDLAGVAIGNAIYMPIAILCMSTLVAINPIVSQHLGARNFEAIGKSARQMIWLVLLLTIPSIILIWNLDIVMRIMGVTPEIIPISQGYLKGVALGILPLFVYSGIRFFSEGLSVTRPAMYIAAGAIVLNIGANYVFMYGKLGLPAMGGVGSGYATSLVNFFSALVFLIFTARFRPFRRFSIFKKIRRPDWPIIKEFLYIGIPNGVSSAMEVLLFATVSLLMGTLSVNASASHQIAISVASTMYMIPLGLSMAITQRVGFSLGQGSIQNARFRGHVGIIICGIIMTITAIILILAPDTIVGLYTKDMAVREAAVTLIFMAGLFQISDGLQVGGISALRGLKDTRVPMFVNLISYWLIGFPIGYYLAFNMEYGPVGLWVGLIFGLTIAAILHNLRFNSLSKPKNAHKLI